MGTNVEASSYEESPDYVATPQTGAHLICPAEGCGESLTVSFEVLYRMWQTDDGRMQIQPYVNSTSMEEIRDHFVLAHGWVESLEP